MAIVNRLQARDFLVRGRAAGDCRRQALNLTAPGLAALIEARAAIREHERWLQARFTGREVRQLKQLLERIHE